MPELRDLYQEVILEHSRAPRNYKALPAANHKAEGYNPLCGDRFTVYLEMDGDAIRDVSFEGAGCAISKASASMMTQSVKGKTKAEAQHIFEQFHELVTGHSHESRGGSGQAGRVLRRFGISDAGKVRHARLAYAAGGSGRQAGENLDGIEQPCSRWQHRRLRVGGCELLLMIITNQTVTLKRDCPAIAVPAGSPQVLPAGTTVRITQAAGTSYTVSAAGALYRDRGEGRGCAGAERRRYGSAGALDLQRAHGVGSAEDGLRSGDSR